MLSGATDPPERAAPGLPRLGWRPTVVRLEMARPMELSEAAYWLASFSRKHMTGVVARLQDGRDLYAWPHQAVEDICKTHLRIEALSLEVGGPGARWNAGRKVRVVDAIQRGLVDKATVQAAFGISDEELESWKRLGVLPAPLRTSA